MSTTTNYRNENKANLKETKTKYLSTKNKLSFIYVANHSIYKTLDEVYKRFVTEAAILIKKYPNVQLFFHFDVEWYAKGQASITGWVNMPNLQIAKIFEKELEAAKAKHKSEGWNHSYNTEYFYQDKKKELINKAGAKFPVTGELK